MEVFEASQTFLAIRGPLDSFVILPQDTSPCYITFVPTYSSSQRPCINISYIFNWQQDFKFHFWKLTVPVFCMTICYFTYYLTGFFFLLLFIVSLINLRWVTPIWDTRKKKKKLPGIPPVWHCIEAHTPTQQRATAGREAEFRPAPSANFVPTCKLLFLASKYTGITGLTAVWWRVFSVSHSINFKQLNSWKSTII